MNIFETLPETIIARSKEADAKLAECPCMARIEEKADKFNPKLGVAVAFLRRGGLWMILWAAVLAFLMFLNIFIHPHHPHFVIDIVPWFWAVFGLGVGVIMVFVMKKKIQPLIVRKEDYYNDI